MDKYIYDQIEELHTQISEMNKNIISLKALADSNKKEIDRLWINVKNLKDGKHNKK